MNWNRREITGGKRRKVKREGEKRTGWGDERMQIGCVHDLGRVCMGFSTPSVSATPPAPALAPPSPLPPPLPACPGPFLFLRPFGLLCEEEEEEEEEANRGCCGPSAASGKTTYHNMKRASE